MMSGNARPTGSPINADRYSYSQYQRDAVVLLEIDALQKQGKTLPNVDQSIVFTEVELATAQTVWCMIQQHHRETTRQRAMEYLVSHELNSVYLHEWRRRFSDGPKEDDYRNNDLDDPPNPNLLYYSCLSLWSCFPCGAGRSRLNSLVLR